MPLLAGFHILPLPLMPLCRHFSRFRHAFSAFRRQLSGMIFDII
jgi:hypothetical protein